MAITGRYLCKIVAIMFRLFGLCSSQTLVNYLTFDYLDFKMLSQKHIVYSKCDTYVLYQKKLHVDLSLSNTVYLNLFVVDSLHSYHDLRSHRDKITTRFVVSKAIIDLLRCIGWLVVSVISQMIITH